MKISNTAPVTPFVAPMTWWDLSEWRLSPALPKRFWDRVVQDLETGCWDWIGYLQNAGYGQIHFRENGKSAPKLAHRVSYEAHRGKIPPDLECDHLCKRKSCISPGHIQLVSHPENMRRIVYPFGHFNRAKTTCPRGHAYDYMTPRGRHCRTCRAASERVRRARLRAA